MKHILPVALALSLAVAVSAVAAEKAPKKNASATPPTVPPTSKMISVTPADPSSQGSEPGKLISSEMSGQALQFFTTVVEAGRTQSFLIDLLKTKGQSERLKALSAALADAQAQENKQVARLAATKGWPVSTEPTPVQRAIGAQLEKQAGPDFDKEVMDKVIAATQESVAAYEAAAKSDDKDIKNFSGQMLPVAREKLELVERLTGAGKAATKLLRTGEPPKVAPAAGSSPAPGAEKAPGATPPAITPSKPKRAAATPVVKQATIPGPSATPAPEAATPESSVPPVNH
jgi:predicted outer membrane protein